MTIADEHDLHRGLSGALQAVSDDGSEPEISALRRLSGGASRETWAFDAVLAPGTASQRLILQRTRPGASFSGPSMDVEDRLLAAAEAGGVPLPPVVLDAAACEPWLGEARVTEFVDGEALGPRIVRGDTFAPARRVLVGQCARALAAIHAINPASVPGLETIDPVTRLRDGLDLLDESRPAFEVAMRWLSEHRPPARPTAVVHGDFRVGNLLVDPDDGLRSVLDWELAHLGDPMEDLGWLCVRAWRFGGSGEVGGVSPVNDLLDAYAEATGKPVDANHVRWWMVAGTLTWGLICAVQARRHLDGQVRSVELAAIGRRVVETEYDLCQLLGIGSTASPAGDPTPMPGTDPASPPHRLTGTNADGSAGAVDDRAFHLDDQAVTPEAAHLPSAPPSIERPTAAELVDAVRAHLLEQVAPALDGSAAFQLRVAGNALAIVEREVRLGPAAAVRARDLLSGLGFADERELAAAVRRGDLLGSTAPAAVIRALVVDRLRIDNPRWLEPSTT